MPILTPPKPPTNPIPPTVAETPAPVAAPVAMKAPPSTGSSLSVRLLQLALTIRLMRSPKAIYISFLVPIIPIFSKLAQFLLSLYETKHQRC
ncbi:hypothetical protein [Lyngbya aestuarii]|uniref:hypothetical protein n=1 Tax=Lyngbya aestuarii TaxID=118322 RepID=UPI00403DF51B